MNIFEQASRKKLRFPSSRGQLDVEQLWDLPLQSRDQFNLDSIAQSVNSQLKATSDESFVSTKENPAKVRLELSLDVIKHVIASKLKEAEENRNRQDRAAKREKLIGVLGEKQDEALRSLTPEEIAKQIEELN